MNPENIGYPPGEIAPFNESFASSSINRPPTQPKYEFSLEGLDSLTEKINVKPDSITDEDFAEVTELAKKMDVFTDRLHAEFMNPKKTMSATLDGVEITQEIHNRIMGLLENALERRYPRPLKKSPNDQGYQIVNKVVNATIFVQELLKARLRGLLRAEETRNADATVLQNLRAEQTLEQTVSLNACPVIHRLYTRLAGYQKRKIGFLQKFLHMIGRIRLDICLVGRFKTHIQAAAPSMSSGALSGNCLTLSIEHAMNIVSKITSNEIPKDKKMMEALGFANELNSKIIGQVDNSNSKQKARFCQKQALILQEKIANLQDGQYLIIPTPTSGHAMMTRIKCVGKNRYEIAHFNTGEGIQNHRRIDGNVQALVFEDLTIERLSVDFFQKILEGCCSKSEGGIEQLYLLLRSQCGQPKAVSDATYWVKEQIGGSCAGASVAAVIKCCLSPGEYVHFDRLAKLSFIFRYYRKIKAGFGTIPIKVNTVYSACVNESKATSNMELKNLLTTIKADIESISQKKLGSQKVSPPPAGNTEAYVNFALSLMRNPIQQWTTIAPLGAPPDVSCYKKIMELVRFVKQSPPPTLEHWVFLRDCILPVTTALKDSMKRISREKKVTKSLKIAIEEVEKFETAVKQQCSGLEKRQKNRV